MVLEIDAAMINCERGVAVPISFRLTANASSACQSLELFTQIIAAEALGSNFGRGQVNSLTVFVVHFLHVSFVSKIIY
jgi:hypothetical protein